MAQIYDVNAYSANGVDVVRNYTLAAGGGLVVVNNGTAGVAPQPGDVISFDNGGLGHVAVVSASLVDSNGNGTVTLISENDTSDGWRTLNVVGWHVQGFGSETPYGWLHDPAGRGNPGAGSALPPSDDGSIALRGDFNGDGRQDVLLVTPRGATGLNFVPLLSNGSTGFTNGGAWFNTGTDYTIDSVKLFGGDFNGDGLSATSV